MSSSRLLTVHMIVWIVLFVSGVGLPAAMASTVVVSGTVREQGSGEAVVGATIALHRDSLVPGRKAERGTYTNRYGFYSLKGASVGRYAVVVTAVGYTPTVTAVVISDTTTTVRLDVDLASRAIASRAVVVEAERGERALDRISTVTVSPAFIKEMPSFGGEVDVFRVLQLLPGVKASSELTAGLYVRGGSPDQNLILLDGVTVYNPSHLGGFLSAFHADALRDIKLVKGAFPAEYGGRLSSVLDMTMKEGNAERIKGNGHISMIASGISIDGPIDPQTTFMISGRRFYADILVGLFTSPTEEMPTYYFYDLNVKINRKLGDRDRLYVSGYFGRDVLASEPSESNSIDVGWGNATANIRWTRLLSDDLFLSTSAIYTDYDFGVDLRERRGVNNTFRFTTDSRIRDYTLRSELQWAAATDHAVKAGIDVTHHAFTSGVSGSAALGGPVNTARLEAIDAALFVQDEWTITDAWRANLGGRLYWFQQGGWVRFEPRVSLAHDVTPTTALTASFAVAHQFLHLITRNDVSLPTDVWFPSTQNIQPSRSVQGVLGMQTQLDDDGAWRFTAEAYYKHMDNLYEYRDDAEFTLGVPLESQFTAGQGRAYGVELFLQKQAGAFTGWLGYTLAWTDRLFADLNNGRRFPPRYDRRHDVSLTLQYRLGESWRFGATWQYGTGQAYTMPAGQYLTSPHNVPWSSPNAADLFTDRNGFRLAAFHKLDLQFLHEYTWFGLPFELSLNVYNAYNRRNPFALYTDYSFDDATGEYRKVIKQLTLFPIIPTVGLRFSF